MLFLSNFTRGSWVKTEKFLCGNDAFLGVLTNFQYPVGTLRILLAVVEFVFKLFLSKFNNCCFKQRCFSEQQCFSSVLKLNKKTLFHKLEAMIFFNHTFQSIIYNWWLFFFFNKFLINFFCQCSKTLAVLKLF